MYRKFNYNNIHFDDLNIHILQILEILYRTNKLDEHHSLELHLSAHKTLRTNWNLIRMQYNFQGELLLSIVCLLYDCMDVGLNEIFIQPRIVRTSSVRKIVVCHCNCKYYFRANIILLAVIWILLNDKTTGSLTQIFSFGVAPSTQTFFFITIATDIISHGIRTSYIVHSIIQVLLRNDDYAVLLQCRIFMTKNHWSESIAL